ncbi:MAG: hypothetical protein V2I37_10720 [Marinilabiliaceae bacterium]|nr:hypothetical protein [Marinilabiliaceae bacterium]
MKKTIILLAAFIPAIFTGCQKEYAPPTLTTPAAQTVEAGTSVNLSFTYIADAGFGTSSVTATNGTASITASGTKGETSGTITVSYTAGSSAGAGSVTLTVIDAEDQSVSTTTVLTVFEEGAPEVTAPGTSNVEVMDPVDISFTFSSEGGYASSSVSATKGTAVVKTEAGAGATSGSVVVTYTAARAAGAGSVQLTITDANGKTGLATAVVEVQNVPTVSVAQNIDADQTWTADKVYILEGRIAVLDGATLTIEAGTIIKGNQGSGPNATALMIARGGKLNANGTANAPIIFTSIADDILPGELVGTTMDPTLNGLWGGLLVLGKAPISADAEAVQIEGIPPSDLNGLYGGTDPLDNSGSITYVSIRHGGANIGEGNEINGLTLGGVGSGTTIQNIEIIANQDDGIEWFGGTVNVTNALVWNTGDDAIDTDQSWSGTLDNAIIVNPGDECFELDGPEGTMVGKHTIINATAYAGDAEGLVDLDPNSNVDMENVYFFGVAAGQDFDELPTVYSCTFADFEVTLPSGSVLTDFFKGGSAAFTTEVAEGQNTVGADATAFSGWTWAAVSGSLSNF